MMAVQLTTGLGTMEVTATLTRVLVETKAWLTQILGRAGKRKEKA